MTKSYCDAYNAGFEKGYNKAKKELERQVLVTSDGHIYPLVTQPQRKKGRWILSDDREWKTCSECGADVDVSLGLGVFVDNDEVSEMCFCPNCGARMDGDADE